MALPTATVALRQTRPTLVTALPDGARRLLAGVGPLAFVGLKADRVMGSPLIALAIRREERTSPRYAEAGQKPLRQT